MEDLDRAIGVCEGQEEGCGGIGRADFGELGDRHGDLVADLEILGLLGGVALQFTEALFCVELEGSDEIADAVGEGEVGLVSEWGGLDSKDLAIEGDLISGLEGVGGTSGVKGSYLLFLMAYDRLRTHFSLSTIRSALGSRPP